MIKKQTGWIVCLLAAATVAWGAGDGKWMTDFEKARERAEKEGLPILANFSGSDWCVWCIRLDREVFSEKAFQEYADKNMVLFLADFPSKTKQPAAVKEQNDKLAKQYGIRGFPTVLLLNADGDVQARTGYKPGGAEGYIRHLESLMKP